MIDFSQIILFENVSGLFRKCFELSFASFPLVHIILGVERTKREKQTEQNGQKMINNFGYRFFTTYVFANASGLFRKCFGLSLHPFLP